MRAIEFPLMIKGIMLFKLKHRVVILIWLQVQRIGLTAAARKFGKIHQSVYLHPGRALLCHHGVSPIQNPIQS